MIYQRFEELLSPQTTKPKTTKANVCNRLVSIQFYIPLIVARLMCLRILSAQSIAAYPDALAGEAPSSMNKPSVECGTHVEGDVLTDARRSLYGATPNTDEMFCL